MTKIAIAIIVILIIISQTFFVVKEGQQALVFQLGKHERTIREPGLHIKIPFIQNVKILVNKVLAADARSADEYMTLDKKRLIVDTVSRWKIEDPLLFYQSVRDYQGAIARLNDIIFAKLRQEIGNHYFREFIREKREYIMTQVAVGTSEQAKRFGINVIDVRIKRVDLPEEVQASVFARMKAERERIAKRYRAEGDQLAREIRADANKKKEIILAEAYKQAQILRGEGDAKSTSTYAAAYTQDEEFYSFLKRLEVYTKVLKNDTAIMMRPDSNLLRYLQSPVGSAGTESSTGASSAK